MPSAFRKWQLNMKIEDLKSVAAALDTLVLHHQATLAKELVEKRSLRQKQLEIASDASRAFEAIQRFDAADAVAHAARQTRYKKLQQMQMSLQPDLAKAALRRELVKMDLRKLLRQKLAVQAQIQSLKNKPAQDPDEIAIETALLAPAAKP